MANFHRKQRNTGFTIPEVLIVAAILVILLGISLLGVSRYVHWLKITELDNAARQIYLAAENRAVLLKNGQQFDRLLGTADAPQTGVVQLKVTDDVSALGIAHNNGKLAELLPAGSIDATLAEHYFYIIYDPSSGSVTDVFYAEAEMDDLNQTFYETWSTASRSKRMKNKPMIGYYGGGTVDADDFGAPPSPAVAVFINNEDELTVTVVCQVPGTSFDASQNLKVCLGASNTADGEWFDLMDSTLSARRSGPTIESVSNGRIYTYTWVLDSLKSENKQFKTLFPTGGPSIDLGSDFTVKAEIFSDEGKFGTAADEDTDNSLYQDGSSGETAYIENLRHLQNLRAAFSGAKNGPQKAEQTNDIFCRSNATYPDYTFLPIENDSLTSYNGGSLEICDLYVNAEEGAAGLFGSVNATGTGTLSFSNIRLRNAEINGSADAGAVAGSITGEAAFSDIRLINTAVSAGSSAGGIAGSISGKSSFERCWVYWEPEEGEVNLSSLLGSDETGYVYKLTGNTAGGLVGHLLRVGGVECTIKNSFAATTVRGIKFAGGLIGDAAVNVTASNSYADCYLTGNGNVAGMIGTSDSLLTLTDCYAAGFIDTDNGSKFAGLCLDDCKTTTKNTYSVLRYVGGDNGTRHSLTEMENAENVDTFNNTFFLSSSSTDEKAKTYAEMTSQSTGSDADFAKQMGDAFVWKSTTNSNPYNLQTYMNLTAYSFPGLQSLPHYGDWGAEFSEPSLVYFEQYKDEKYGFSGGNARYLVSTLSDEQTIVSDGYAVAFLKNDLPDDSSSVEVKFTYFNGTVLTTSTANYSTSGSGSNSLIETKWKDLDGVEASYYLALLPDELVQNAKGAAGETLTTVEDFFQYLKFELKLGGTSAEEISGESFYNPHFAETVNPYRADEEAPDGTSNGDVSEWSAEDFAQYAGGLLDAHSAISVRTPRHLFNLSLAPDYYHNEKHPLVFSQGLDLDYSAYRGYSLFEADDTADVYLQTPIGTQSKPFNAIYNGGCHSISGVGFRLDGIYAGLFGHSSGTLRNIVYRMADAKDVPVGRDGFGKIYIGSLAGRNSGQMENCAAYGVRVSGTGTTKSVLYIGGLVGENHGSIRNCAAECASLSASSNYATNAYIGGLVGSNEKTGTINLSYAVGKLTAAVDNDTSYAKLCGFVGSNSGRISNCYAAANLASTGKTIETYGFCGEANGSQSNNFYLNEGNFTYRNEGYAAVYPAAKATGIRYADLKAGSGDAQRLLSAGMRHEENGVNAVTGDPAITDNYPYPAIIRDASGSYIHYGQWPESMLLGDMGVYYWEQLQISGKSTYHVSLLAVDTNAYTITSQSTLSNAHTDGGVVTDYGYGYYFTTPADENAADTTYRLESDTILYSDDGRKGGSFTENEQFEDAIDEDVGNQLAKLMEGYTFRPYHSFGLAEGGGGLYPKSKDENTSPNGTLKLIQQKTLPDGQALTVAVQILMNPHFADALSFDPASKTPFKQDWEFDTQTVQTSQPGSTEGHPYEVRAVSQLQNINWNSTNQNTGTVLNSNNNNEQFPYLSYAKDKTTTTGGLRPTTTVTTTVVQRSYYWEQSHDLSGKDANGNYVAYTPIAEYYDSSVTLENRSTLYGWFGGTYDGKDYMIENLNITGQTSSCAGMFGIVFNGELNNIILYSSDGKGLVKCKSDKDTRSLWYCAGTLAGIAAADTAAKSVVNNCAAAGYTIDADIITYRNKDETGQDKGWGGNCIGGLIGFTNMNLSKCTAVTDIYSPDTIIGNDNVRLAGLVGSCQGEILNCYAGGQIDVEPLPPDSGVKGIHIGGIVASSYMKPLQVGAAGTIIGYPEDADGLTDNSITNCYSFVKLPSYKDEKIKSLYAIGGTGDIPPPSNKYINGFPPGVNAKNHGLCTIKNCYYLSSVKPEDQREKGVKTDLVQITDVQTQVTGLTYEQLAGKEPITSQYFTGSRMIGELLPAFSWVETEYHGLSVPGRYSFNASRSLDGNNYPFPTVLTMAEEGKDVNVHYGDWPIVGITRPDYGGLPISIDLFAPTADDSENGVWTETLELGENIASTGDWALTLADDDVLASSSTVTANTPGDKAVLKLVGAKVGTTTVEITYTVSGKTYSLSIPVHVQADLILRPSDNPVNVFTNDTTTLVPSYYGSSGSLLSDPLVQSITLDLSGSAATFSSDHFASAVITEADGTNPASLTVVSKNAVTDSTPITIPYKYTYQGVNYDGTSTTSVCITAPVVEYTDVYTGADPGRTAKITFEVPDRSPVSISNAEIKLGGNSLKAESNGNTVTVSRWTNASPQILVTLTMNERTHQVTVDLEKQPPQSSGNAESQSLPVNRSAEPSENRETSENHELSENRETSGEEAFPEDGGEPVDRMTPEGGAPSVNEPSPSGAAPGEDESPDTSGSLEPIP